MANKADVIIENEQTACDFTEQMETVIADVVNTVLEQEGFAPCCEVSVLITDDEAIRLLNAEHRGKDSATDVLSFPMLEFGDDGEITSGRGLRRCAPAWRHCYQPAARICAGGGIWAQPASRGGLSVRAQRPAFTRLRPRAGRGEPQVHAPKRGEGACRTRSDTVEKGVRI